MDVSEAAARHLMLASALYTQFNKVSNGRVFSFTPEFNNAFWYIEDKFLSGLLTFRSELQVRIYDTIDNDDIALLAKRDLMSFLGQGCFMMRGHFWWLPANRFGMFKGERFHYQMDITVDYRGRPGDSARACDLVVHAEPEVDELRFFKGICAVMHNFELPANLVATGERYRHFKIRPTEDTAKPAFARFIRAELKA
jgi:hypothetical protein